MFEQDRYEPGTQAPQSTSRPDAEAERAAATPGESNQVSGIPAGEDAGAGPQWTAPAALEAPWQDAPAEPGAYPAAWSSEPTQSWRRAGEAPVAGADTYETPAYDPAAWSGYEPGHGPETPAPDVEVAPVRGRRPAGRLAGAIVGTALLAAAFSAAATYGAVSLLARPAAPAQAVSQTPTGVLTSVNQSDAIVRAAATIKPSVVTILTEGSSTGVSPFNVPTSGAGSGVVVSAGGLILTNNHVVQGADKLTVTLSDGRQVSASVVVTDTKLDLAVIRAATTGLTPARLGDSSKLQVGQLAIAVGSPLGTFTDSVTQGIISGLNRDITAGDRGSNFSEQLTGLIQTDAAINPGNSGGPLLDASGNVIGLITAGANDAQGVGFAVPINTASQLIARASHS